MNEQQNEKSISDQKQKWKQKTNDGKRKWNVEKKNCESNEMECLPSSTFLIHKISNDVAIHEG